MESFYLVLPSNTPFPGNTTSDYLVKLPNIIDLSDGNWSVALSSIIYPLSFSGIDEEQKIEIHYEDDKVSTINIPKRLQYSSVKQFENIINESILNSLLNETKVGLEQPRSKRDIDTLPDQRIKIKLKTPAQPTQQTPPTEERIKIKLKTPAQPIEPNQQQTPIVERPKPPIRTKTVDQVEQQTQIVQQAQVTIEQPPLMDQRPKPPVRAKVEDRVEQQAQPKPIEQLTTDLQGVEAIHEPTIDERIKIKPKTPIKSTAETTQPLLPTVERIKIKTKEPIISKDAQAPDVQIPIEQPQAQIQLTDKERQALDTAKRVTNTISDELELGYQSIEKFIKECMNINTVVTEAAIPDNAFNAKTLKIKILEEAGPLISLKNLATIELNKAREAKVKTSIAYQRQNVRDAKISTDQIKSIKKKLLNSDDDNDPSFLDQIKKRHKNIFNWYEEFAKDTGLPPGKLENVQMEAMKYFLETNKAYNVITDIVDELYTYMGELENDKSNEAKNLLYTIEPIIAQKTISNSKFTEIELLKYQLGRYHEENNLKEAQNVLLQIKDISKLFLDDESGYLTLTKEIKKRVLIEILKYKQSKAYKEAKNIDKIIRDEDKADVWSLSKEIASNQRVFGQESQTEGHIPKPIPLQEKIDKETSDTWNIIDNDEKQLFDYRKEDVEEKIKNLLDKNMEQKGYTNVKRSLYQQIFFYFDSDQLQRFYLWTSYDPLFKIRNIKISKQLAYMLGFTDNNEGYVDKNNFAKYSPDVSGGLHTFYVYCPNLVANTVIGNQYGPLLRVVNVDMESKNKVVETIYTQEFHHKVILKQIPEINIKILSDSGRPIEFNWGNCIVTLHFKRALF